MSGLKIEAIEARSYRLPLDPPFHAAWDPEPRRFLDCHAVVVRAGGHEGVGSGDRLAGWQHTFDLFVGRDVLDIERHARVLDNLQFHYGRMWSVEIALWDLIGKIKGAPVWRLLGGENPTLRPYASTGQRLPASERVQSVLRLLDEGFDAVKLRFWADDPDEDIAVVRLVREAVGDQMTLLVDANQAWRMPWDTRQPWELQTAERVADELAELGVYWLEEPLDRHAYDDLARLRGRAGLKIAGGEGNREFAEFERYLAHGSLDVYQADVAWSTGLLRAKDLAERVAAAGATYTPHTWGDGLVLLANLHAAAAFGNAGWVELPYDPPYWTPERRDYMLPAPILPDASGRIMLGDAPGLGTEIDWQAIEPLRVT
jgi:D-galactarolactone cycloisomerase